MQYDGGRLSSTVTTSLAALAVAGLYVGGTEVGLLLTPHNQPVSLLWPPNALLQAALLLAPRRMWPAYVLAVFPAHLATQLWHDIPLATSVGWYFTNVSEAMLGAYGLCRLRPPRAFFQSLSGLAQFLSISVIGATGLTTFLDAAVVVATGSDQGYWQLWERRFVSNALATLTLVPPIVMLASSSITRVVGHKPAWLVESALLALGTLVVVQLFLAMQQETQATIPALIYTMLPLLFWAAVRFGPAGVSLLLLVGACAILWTAHDREPLSLRDVWSLQMLLAMMSVLSLSLAVVVRERSRLQSLHGAVLHSIPDSVAIVDIDGVIVETNHAWVEAGAAADRAPFVGIARYANYLDVVRSCDEQPDDSATLVAGLAAILARSSVYFQMEYSRARPEQTRWFSIAAVPLRGEQRGAVITHSDITARKRADAETIHVRDQLAHAGRVMTMGMLSASLTHELSQPLAAVLGNAQAAKRLLARDSWDQHELDEILADIVAGSKRTASILRRLHDWFQRGVRDSQPVNLNTVVAEVVALLQADLLRRGVCIVSRLAPRGPHVRGDRLQLQQVVLNLIVNACDAMRQTTPEERQIVVRTGHNNGRVELSVADTGTGFPPDRLGSMFEPFVTTKPAGLGLGLALCRAIVHAHDGELAAMNNRDRGATVSCTLPGVDVENEHAAEETTPPELDATPR